MLFLLKLLANVPVILTARNLTARNLLLAERVEVAFGPIDNNPI